MFHGEQQFRSARVEASFFAELGEHMRRFDRSFRLVNGESS
jgi:hypothetical protein